jgi:hypothetical protein
MMLRLFVLPLLLSLSHGAAAQELFDVFEAVAGRPNVELVEARRDEAVRGHLIGLGAMQKVRGVWGPDESVRLSGELSRFTWRLLDGYPSELLLEDLEAELSAGFVLESLYRCEARACGDSAQWANRMFGERVLYGRADSQRYRVYATSAAGVEYRLMLYASARTSDRQYLHAEVLALDES